VLSGLGGEPLGRQGQARVERDRWLPAEQFTGAAGIDEV
jgi:hypothetical protein